MKFYYQDKLIRTSKNHKYTHAVIDMQTENDLGCRTSMDACQSIITAEISRCLQEIGNAKAMIKALEEGKSGYFAREGRKTWWSKFDNPSYHTIENAQSQIEWYQSRIEEVQQYWKIVELECR